LGEIQAADFLNFSTFKHNKVQWMLDGTRSRIDGMQEVARK